MVGVAIVGNVIGGVGLVTVLRLMQLPHKVIGERDDDDPKGKGQLSRSARSKSVHATVEIAADKVGIEDVGAHTLRHSAAVGWLESGVHIEAAADLLGHASISIPGDLYGHTSDDAARDAVSGLGDALGL
jgi:integrase